MYKVGDVVIVHTNKHPRWYHDFSHFRIGMPFMGPVVEVTQYNGAIIYRVMDTTGHAQWVYLGQTYPVAPSTEEDWEEVVG